MRFNDGDAESTDLVLFESARVTYPRNFCRDNSVVSFRALYSDRSSGGGFSAAKRAVLTYNDNEPGSRF